MKSKDRSLSVAVRADEFGDLIPYEWTQRPLYRRVIAGVLGALLIVVGLVGWLVPVIPGFFLVPIGILLIAATSKWCAKCVNALERKLPYRVRRLLHRHHTWNGRRRAPKPDPLKAPE